MKISKNYYIVSLYCSWTENHKVMHGLHSRQCKAKFANSALQWAIDDVRNYIEEKSPHDIKDFTVVLEQVRDYRELDSIDEFIMEQTS